MSLARWFFALLLIIGGFLAGKVFRAPQRTAVSEPVKQPVTIVESSVGAIVPEVSVDREASAERRTGAIPVSHGAPEIMRTPSKRAIDDWETSRTIEPISELPPPPLSAYESRETITPVIVRQEPKIQEPPAPPREKSHRIVDGDTLETLALRYFNDPAAAERILNDNRNQISDRSLLPVGKTIRIRIPAP